MARLKLLGDEVGVEVNGRHMNISQSRKRALLKNPAGILLITPESLEAFLVLRNQIMGRNCA